MGDLTVNEYAFAATHGLAIQGIHKAVVWKEANIAYLPRVIWTLEGVPFTVWELRETITTTAQDTASTSGQEVPLEQGADGPGPTGHRAALSRQM